MCENVRNGQREKEKHREWIKQINGKWDNERKEG